MHYQKFILAGWPGICIDNKKDQELLSSILRQEYLMEPIFFDQTIIESLVDPCFLKMINPLLMNFINLKNTDIVIQDCWDTLLRFSEIFSQEVGKLIKRTSYILFLDHYLMLVPSFMRKLYTIKQLACTLGLYLNNVFSSYSVMKLFPFAEDIIESLLSLEVVVFQSFEHLDGFVQMVRDSKKVNYKIEKGVMYVYCNNRTTILRVGGIIAFNTIVNDILKTANFQINYQAMQAKHEGKYIIVSFDPLSSYSGVELRLEGLNEFVRHNCSKSKAIHFIQIINNAVPWVNFSKIAKSNVEKYVALFANFSSSNLTCELVLTSDITDETLFGYLRLANLFLNTRLSSSSDPIMVNYFLLNENAYGLMSDFSAFDRYASTMIKVNPYNKQSFFQGLMKIFKASGYFSQKDLLNEKERNPKVIESVDAQQWLEGLLLDMRMVKNLKGEGNDSSLIMKLDYISRPTYKLDAAKFKTSFKTAKKMLLLFGLEGTLTSQDKNELMVTNEGKTVRLPPKVNKELVKHLESISRDKRANLFVMTSRSLEDVKQIFGENSHLGLAAEKGYYFKMPGDPAKSKWEHICDFNESWKTVAMNLMKQYERKILGSLTEYSNTGVRWTFDINADEITYRQAQALKDSLQKILANYTSIEVVSEDGFVEVMHHVISKAAFAELLIRYLQQEGEKIDLIVALGSGNPSEHLFSSLNILVADHKLVPSTTELYCVSVGTKSAQAKYYINSQYEMESIIKEIKSCIVAVNMPKPGSFTA